jgi:hypothetical protein
MMSEARPQLVLLRNRGIERREYRITKQERNFSTAPGRRYERFSPRTLPLSIADRTLCTITAFCRRLEAVILFPD